MGENVKVPSLELDLLTASGQEILRIPAWKKSFELVKRELEAILEKEIFPSSQRSGE